MYAHNEEDLENDSESDEDVAASFVRRWMGRDANVSQEIDGNRQSEVGSRDCQSEVAVQRPIEFRGRKISFDVETQSRASFREMDWYFPILDRYLEAGYHNGTLVSVFRGIPNELATVMKESLQALQILRSSALKKAAASARVLDALHASAQSAISCPTEFETWDAPEECGCVTFHWHPATQVRIPSSPARHARTHALPFPGLLGRLIAPEHIARDLLRNARPRHTHPLLPSPAII